ncbi:MAG: hypothetical protein HYZ53_22780 [Planctomycetes bacterium]|nr:hypothetical protein [Planctomycetota bacterium]
MSVRKNGNGNGHGGANGSDIAWLKTDVAALNKLSAEHDHRMKAHEAWMKAHHRWMQRHEAEMAKQREDMKDHREEMKVYREELKIYRAESLESRRQTRELIANFSKEQTKRERRDEAITLILQSMVHRMGRLEGKRGS